MAKNSILDYSTTPDNNTDIGGIGIQGTSAVNNFDNAFRTLMSQMRQDIDYRRVYTVKSTNYTAVLNDNNASLVFSAAATLSLTAAATLGTNWHVRVYAKGGQVTIDPNASETIDGSATLIVGWGGIVDVFCDGSNFVTMRVDTGIEAIGAPVNLAGVAQVDWTGLADFETLCIKLSGIPSVAAANVGFRISTNNGASYLSGATDYSWMTVNFENGASSVSTQSTATIAPIVLSTAPINIFPFQSETWITNFNKSGTFVGVSKLSYFNSATGLRRSTEFNTWGPTTARNALRLVSDQTFATGLARIYGMRG